MNALVLLVSLTSLLGALGRQYNREIVATSKSIHSRFRQTGLINICIIYITLSFKIFKIFYRLSKYFSFEELGETGGATNLGVFLHWLGC